MQPISSTIPRNDIIGPIIGNRVARFVVPDMGTRGCIRQVTDRMRQLDGVKAASANVSTHKVVVQFVSQLTGLGKMTAEIERAGCNVADLVQTGVASRSRGMQLAVSGMDCDHYADHLTRALKRLPGVLVVTTKLADQSVAVHFAPDKVDARMITAAVERAGYGIVCTEDI
jgi:copper ion binding protein